MSDPRPTIFWRKKLTPIHDIFPVHHTFLYYHMRLNITWELGPGEYVCDAENSIGSSSTAMFVTVGPKPSGIGGRRNPEAITEDKDEKIMIGLSSGLGSSLLCFLIILAYLIKRFVILKLGVRGSQPKTAFSSFWH